MAEDEDTLLVLSADEIPDRLRNLLGGNASRALLASLELTDDGRVVVQLLPEVDPLLVARVRKIFAQYEDVLRRLS